MRAICFLFLIVGIGQAQAQWSFTLDPASPAIAGQEIAVRIDEPFGCFPANIINVTRDGASVGGVAHIEDASPPGPCPVTWVTPRFVSLGTFAPGHYEVRVTACTNAPPPLPECELRTTLALAVFGVSGTAFMVPTLSEAMMTGLAFAVIVIGAFMARRR